MAEEATKSNEAPAALRPGIRWAESFIVAYETFCVHPIKDEAIVRRHVEIGGLPATEVGAIGKITGPAAGAAMAVGGGAPASRWIGGIIKMFSKCIEK